MSHSSNPLLAELRQHAAFRKSFPQEHRMVLAAADEIERLTRELAEANAKVAWLEGKSPSIVGWPWDSPFQDGYDKAKDEYVPQLIEADYKIERLTRELERFEVHFLKLRTEGFGLARDNTQDLIQVAKRLRAALVAVRDLIIVPGLDKYVGDRYLDIARDIAREALRPAEEGDKK